MRAMRTAVVALATVVSTGAQAAPYAALLDQFNEIVFGNVISGSETEGRAVISGTLTQSGSGNYCFQTDDGTGPCGTASLPATTPTVTGVTVGAATQSLGALTVYGNVSGSGVTGQNGNVFIGGTNTGALSMPSNSQTAYVATQGTSSKVGGQGNLVATAVSPGVTAGSQNGSVKTGSFVLPGFAAAFQTPLQYLSSYLNGLTGIAQGTSNAFTAAPTTINGVKVTVYDVSGSNLAAAIRNFNFSLNGAQTVVINVIGAVSGLSTNLNTFRGQDDVIWNFATQTSLTLPGWAGTILAPDANLTITGVSQGDIVAASLNQGNNEIHDYAFTGDLDFVPDPTVAAVSEPGGLAVLAVGLSGVACARRRRATGASPAGGR